MVKAKSEVEAVSKERDEVRPPAVLLSVYKLHVMLLLLCHNCGGGPRSMCGGTGGEEGGEAAVSVRPSQEAATC